MSDAHTTVLVLHVDNKVRLDFLQVSITAPAAEHLEPLLTELFAETDGAVFFDDANALFTRLSALRHDREVVLLIVVYGESPVSQYRNTMKSERNGVYTASEQVSRPTCQEYLASIGCSEKLPRIQKLSTQTSVEEDEEDEDNIRVTWSWAAWAWDGPVVNGVQHRVVVKAVDGGVTFTLTLNAQEATKTLLETARKWAAERGRVALRGSLSRT